MLIKKRIFTVCFLLGCSFICKAQIEVDHLTMKDFKSTGFGGFLNFSLPVSDADYATAEFGVQYYNDKSGDDVALIPVLAGYRYTINRSGTGFYLEPNAGYTFGSTAYGNEVNGATAGMNLGYLFEFTGSIQFNLALRYEHTFSTAASNLFAFRISHAITFKRRDDY